MDRSYLFWSAFSAMAFFWSKCRFHSGMASTLRASSSSTRSRSARSRAFSAAFFAIISRFHRGISAPVASEVGT